MRKIFTSVAIAATALGVMAQTDYTQGVFIINEGWYGHENSTVNYFNPDAEDGNRWTYRAIQTENAGMELGATSQYGQIYGDKFYVIAKQAQDPGASVTGGRITVVDAKTLKVIYQSVVIDPAGDTSKPSMGGVDGRAFLGVDETKGYISTSDGVWVLNTEGMVVTKKIGGTGSESGSLYAGQCGTMVRVNDKVFVAHQSAGLLVINPDIDEVIGTISMEDIESGAGIGSVVLGSDGFLYVSLADGTSGSGGALPYIVKIDPKTTQVVEKIAVPTEEGIYPPANSWYAWTPDGFCASTQNKCLYWNGGESSWFSNTKIFKYDIETGEFSQIIDLDGEGSGWKLYGCSMRVHPVTDEIYLSLYQDFGSQTYALRRADTTGQTIQDYDMIANYWFPSLPVFPDNAYPTVAELGVQNVSGSSSTTISLADLAHDEDNMDAAIVKSVASVSDSKMFTARVVDGDLLIIPSADGATGTGSVELKVNSNGHVVNTTIPLSFGTSGITDIEHPAMAAIVYRDGVLGLRGVNGLTCCVYTTSGALARSFTVEGDDVEVPVELASGLYIVKVGGHTAKIVIR